MMPQRETGESMHEQATPPYGRYEGGQPFTQQFDERSAAHPPREARGEKVYPPRHTQKNRLRLGIFMIAMVMLLLCAVLCLFFLGGTGGWVSFIVAATVIFLITVVAIDKLE
jgi:hypothetical protein